MSFMHPLAAPFFLSGGQHAVLLMHGFTGSPAHMRPLGEMLNAAGFTVRGIALRGHGTTVQDMMSASWKDWLQDARTACSGLFDSYRYVSVAGLSMGGILSLILAAEHSGTARPLTACIPIEAPLGTTNRYRHFALLAAPFCPILNKHHDGSRDTLDKAYDIDYDKIPTAKTHDLNVLIARARRSLSSVTCPVLAVQSHMDKTVSQNSIDIILNNISDQKKAPLWLNDAPHVATISPEKDVIAEGMIRFLREAEKAAEGS